MAFIYKTENFDVISHNNPFASREDGGHIKIVTKISAIQLMRLTMLIGDAMKIAMNNQGIPVVKINYEDLGNWAWKTGKKPHLHIHIFGRSETATKQIFPEAVFLPARESGFYDRFNALTKDNIAEIQKQIRILEQTEKYNLRNWNL